jgi:hypothetical protein
MHAVRVGVGVKGMGVRVIVGVRVEGNGLFVGVIVTVDVARAVIFTHGVFDVWIVRVVSVPPDAGRAISPHACKSVIRMQ